ncbi:MAG: ATP-dependent DNA helicase RecG [Candidatus Levybacteria bacterium]|nr:ATP-dependent DNA helicase RecG [Candidatus Levybacteria bacterium]
MDLQTPISNAGRFYKMYAHRLEKLGIITLEDFLYHIPSRYENYSLISRINELQAGEIVTIQATVTEIKNEFTKNGKRLQKAKVEDGTGEIDVIWFNQPFLINVIRKGDLLSLSGKVDWFSRRLVLQSPEYETINDDSPTIHTGRFVPIYPETKGVSSKWLRRQIYKTLQEYRQNLLEYIPDSIIQRNNFYAFSEAIEKAHFPKNLEEARKARERLAFDELFLLQLAALKRRSIWEKQLVGHHFTITTFQKQIEEFWEKLPFELTNAQKKAVKDIFADLASKKPMNRLLEGDVGSGKTVVSAIAMYIAHLNGFQSVLMAPTEILVLQHYQTISKLLEPFGVKVGLRTGAHKGKDEADILVGTHAVLSDEINFKKLGLVVIDEQQRFGVEQRSIIRQKGKNPHLLTMTATPIPRTVALTLYGDLDLSYLDEMPKGRKKIKTWLVRSEKRESAYEWIKKQIENGDQVFIICPFIEESETMQTIKAAQKEYQRLQKEVFPNLKLGLLHGRLKAKEKDGVLQKFRDKELDILVATPVVEVGIDIPNATIILIEASERFGLAQLHQLRGRVGRGEKQSYCLLFTEIKNSQTIERIRAMETMHVGAELAEFDLRLRGPGELYGTMQHGVKQLKIASFSDFPLIEKTRREAEKIFPKLSDYPYLWKKLKYLTTKEVSPD